MTASKVTLYRLYNSIGELLYVGLARDFQSRMSWHKRHQPWWSEVNPERTALAHISGDDMAADAEHQAIALERPRYNKAGVSRTYSRYAPSPVPVVITKLEPVIVAPGETLVRLAETAANIRRLRAEMAEAEARRDNLILEAYAAHDSWASIQHHAEITPNTLRNILRRNGALRSIAQPPA